MYVYTHSQLKMFYIYIHMASYAFLIIFGDQVTWNVKPNNTGVLSQQSWESNVLCFLMEIPCVIVFEWVYDINTMIYIYIYLSIYLSMVSCGDGYNGQVQWIHRKSIWANCNSELPSGNFT